MALNVGELEATLKLKTDLEAQLATAKQALAKFGTTLQQTGATGSASMSALDGVVGKLAATFTTGAVIKFASDIVDAAGKLKDLHDKTKISIEGLQSLGLVATQSGSSIEAVSTAVFQMGKRLAGGDDAAANAVKELGLNFETIRAMRPEDAFTTLGKAVSDLNDPMKQAQLGAALFGKSVQDLLPVFKNLDDAQQSSVKYTADQVEALDVLGDKWDAFKSSLGPAALEVLHLGDLIHVASKASDLWSSSIAVLTGRVGEFAKVGGPAADVVAKYAQAVKDRATPAGAGLLDVFVHEKSILSDLDDQFQKNTEAVKTHAEAAKKAAEDLKKWTAAAKAVESEMFRIPEALGKVGTAVDMAQLGPLMDRLAQVEQTARIANFGFQGMTEGLDKIGTHSEVALDAMDGWAFVGPKFIDAGQETTKFSEVLGALANDVVQLAQIGGDSFGPMAKAIGTAIKQADLLVKAITAIGDSASTTGQRAMAMGTGFVTAFGMMLQVAHLLTDDSEIAAAALAEFAASTAQDFQSASGFSQQLTTALRETNNQMIEVEHNGRRFGQHLGPAAAEALHLSEIIRELGGLSVLTADQLSVVQDRLVRLIQIAQQSGTLGAQAVRQLDDVLIQIGRSAIDSGGLVSQFFLDTIQQAQRAGVVLPQVNALFRQFGQTAVSSFNAIAAAGASDQRSLDALGTQAVATFAAAVASGTSFYAALKAIDPGIQALRKSYVDLGLTTNNAAMQGLLYADAILKSNPELLAAIEGLVGESTALYNMGLLTAESFAAMEETGAAMYARLQAAAAAAGGGTREALLPMQAWLQKATEEAARLGVPLDANTQQMIDQSRELGIWRDIGPSTQQQMIDLTTTLGDRMADVVRLLTGLVDTDPLGKTATSAQAVNTQVGGLLTALGQIPASLPNPFAGWTMPNLPSIAGQDTLGPPLYMAAGGVVPARGTDTVPAMLTPGEVVLPSSRALQGAMSGETTQTFVIQVYMNGKHLADAMVPNIPSVVKRYRLTR